MSRRSARSTAAAAASLSSSVAAPPATAVSRDARSDDKMEDSSSSATAATVPKTTRRSGKRKAESESVVTSITPSSARRGVKRSTNSAPPAEDADMEVEFPTSVACASSSSSSESKRRPSNSPAKKRAKKMDAVKESSNNSAEHEASEEQQNETKGIISIEVEPLFPVKVNSNPFAGSTHASSASASSSSSSSSSSSAGPGSLRVIPLEVCTWIMQYFSCKEYARFAAVSRSAYSSVFNYAEQLRARRVEHQNAKDAICTLPSRKYYGLHLQIKSLASLRSLVSSSLRNLASKLTLYNSSGRELLATNASNTTIIAANLPSLHALHLCLTTEHPKAVTFPAALRRLELNVRYKLPSAWHVRATKEPIWTPKQQLEWNEHLIHGISKCAQLQHLSLWTSSSMRKQLAQTDSNDFLKPLQCLRHLDTLRYHLSPVTLSLDQYDIIRSLPSLTILEDCGAFKLDLLLRLPLPRHFKIAQLRSEEDCCITAKDLASLVNISHTLTALTSKAWNMVPNMYDQLAQFTQLKTFAFGESYQSEHPPPSSHLHGQISAQSEALVSDNDKLVAALERMSHLEDLKLFVRDLDSAHLQRILAGLSNLRCLELQSDSINSLEAFTKVSTLACRLTELSLKCPKVPREQVTHLLQLRCLRSLCIEGTFNEPLFASQLYHFKTNKQVGHGSSLLRQLEHFIPRGYSEVVPPEPAASAEERARHAAALEDRYRAAPGTLPLSSIERLPASLLVLFISFMDLRSFVRAGRVSRSWRAAASAPGAWPLTGRKVKLRVLSTPPILNLQQFIHATEIETLPRNFMDRENAGGEANLQLIMQLKRLRALWLNQHVWILPSVVKCFQTIGPSLLQLTINADPPSGFFSFLPVLENLTWGVISSFPRIEELSKLTALKTFNLKLASPLHHNGEGDAPFTDTHRLQWCSVLRSLCVDHSLRHLDLEGVSPLVCAVVSSMAGLKFELKSDGGNWEKYQIDLKAWRRGPALMTRQLASVPFPGFDWQRVAAPAPLLSLTLRSDRTNPYDFRSHYPPAQPALCIPSLIELHVEDRAVNLLELRAFAADHRMSSSTQIASLTSLNIPTTSAVPHLLHFPALTDLDLCNLGRWNSIENVRISLEGLSELRRLRCLRLKGCKISNAELASLRLPLSLEQLQLEGIQVDGSSKVEFSPATLAATLFPLKRLQYLKMSRVPLLPLLYRDPPSTLTKTIVKSRSSKSQTDLKQERLETEVDEMDIDPEEVESKSADAFDEPACAEMSREKVRCVMDILSSLHQLTLLRWNSHEEDIARMEELTQAYSSRPKKGGTISEVTRLRRKMREMSRIREALRLLIRQRAKHSPDSSSCSLRANQVNSPLTVEVLNNLCEYRPLVQADHRNVAAVASAAKSQAEFNDPRTSSYDLRRTHDISQAVLAIVDENEMRAEAEEEAEAQALKERIKAAKEATKDAPVKKRKKTVA